jgi:hypothetical protein
LAKWKENKDPLLLLNIVLRRVSLPVDVLIPLTNLNPQIEPTKILVGDGGNSGDTWTVEGSRAPREQPVRDNLHLSDLERKKAQTQKGIKLYKRNQKALANKVIHGNGTAVRNQRCAATLKGLHPDRGRAEESKDATLRK